MSPAIKVLEIPVFPLPNVVFFPRTLLPLHIFEPRYRLMIADILEGQRLLGMTLVKPEWEESRSESDDVYEIGGLGELTECQQLQDGNYDILLTGRNRYRILQFTRCKPYRIAQVEILSDTLPIESDQDSTTRLLELYGALIEEASDEQNRELLARLDYPSLVNSICSTINIDVYSKQRLLEIDSLETRSQRVQAVLQHLIEQKRFVADFERLRPEDPSVN